MILKPKEGLAGPQPDKDLKVCFLVTCVMYFYILRVKIEPGKFRLRQESVNFGVSGH